MANKITYDDKAQYADIPSVPANQKLTYADANEIKDTINANYQRLPLNWATDITDGQGLDAGQLLIYNGVLYRCTTGYNVGTPKTFTIGNFEKGLDDSGTGVLDPVDDIAALQALDTTDADDYPDKWTILVEDVGDGSGQWYRFDRDSSATESLPNIVEPASGPGRFISDTKVKLDAKADKADTRTYTSSSPSIASNQVTLNFDSKNEGEFTIATTITAALEVLVSNTTNAVRAIIRGKITGTYGVDLTEFGTTVSKAEGEDWTYSAGVVTIAGATATPFEITLEKHGTDWNVITYVFK